MRTALIDGDAIAYVLGWNLRDETSEDLMHYSIDNFLNSNLILLEATHYIGALSSKPVFRDQVYRMAKYKGTRGEEHEAIKRWKPTVKKYLESKWSFVAVANLEADDIVGYHAFNESLGERIICSPDKDLRQIPGKLFDYQKGNMYDITPELAKYYFNMQMLCGDTTDNIKGIPGMGEVKSKKLLEEQAGNNSVVYDAYVKYFGNFYGTIIYEETLATVMVMQPGHSYESYFENQLRQLQAIPCELKENTVLRELDLD